MIYITTKQAQAIDKKAQEKLNIPSIILMENAGRASALLALDMLKRTRTKKAILICAKGNNGGDGLVCARHLINNNIKVDVFLIGSPGDLKKDPAINYRILKNMKTDINIIKHDKNLALLNRKLKKADLLIDAIFGIGLSGRIQGLYKQIIDIINNSKKKVLSLDTPSGLDATTGKILGACVRASKTITFALPKTGFRRNTGPEYAGDIIVADISIPKILL